MLKNPRPQTLIFSFLLLASCFLLSISATFASVDTNSSQVASGGSIKTENTNTSNSKSTVGAVGDSQTTNTTIPKEAVAPKDASIIPSKETATSNKTTEKSPETKLAQAETSATSDTTAST